MSIEQIRESLYRITTPYDQAGMVFLYLLKGDSIALVDTGAADSPGRVIQPALAEIGLALSDVDVLLTTHAHLDHSGGNLEAKRLSGAQIYVHAAEQAMAKSTAAQVEFHVAPLRALDFPAEAIQERVDNVLRNAGKSVEADVLLADGDVVDLGAGVKLRAIHCPGHTPGQLAFYWEAEGVLLTGDAVQGQGPRPGGYPYYFNACDYRRSLAKLAELDFRLLGLGHAFPGGTPINEPTRRGPEAKAFLQASMDVADTIHRAVAEAVQRLPGASKREIALAALAELIYEIPQLRVRQTGMPLLAGPTLLAHIEAATAGDYPF